MKVREIEIGQEIPINKKVIGIVTDTFKNSNTTTVIKVSFLRKD